MGKMNYTLEEYAFKRAWFEVTGMREFKKTDEIRIRETIKMLHKFINRSCNKKLEKKFCHDNLYKRYLEFVSEEYDSNVEFRRKRGTKLNEEYVRFKLKMIGAWCNKSHRVETFVLSRLAEYTPPKKEIKQPTRGDLSVDGVMWLFLFEDKYGVYYSKPNSTEIIARDHLEIYFQAFEDFVENNPVTILDIVKGLKEINDPTPNQLRFIRSSTKRNTSLSVLPGQSGVMPKKNSGRVLAVRRRGPNNRPVCKIQVRKTNT
jgi:hypothetical protein